VPQRVTLGELVVGGAVICVAALAEVSLALADARAWSLAGSILLTLVVLAVAAVLLVRHRPAVEVSPIQLAVVGAVGLATFVLVVPGFPVGMAGWDPGVYTNHALAIARTGDYDLKDPVLDRTPALPDGTAGESNARFPGTSYSGHHDGRSVVGFFHLYPALMAPAAKVAGERGAINVNPVLGVLAAMALTLLAWRAFGAWSGGVAGAVVATNMIQVWHARYPTSEVLTELLLIAALLAIVIARDTGWRAAAGAGGVLTGLIFLARGDGFLIVLMAVGALAALSAVGRFDQRAWWFAGGLALTMPHALAQAYDFAETYRISQGLPSPGKLLGAIALLVVAGLVATREPVRRLARRGIALVAERRRAVGIAVVLALTLLFVAAYLRPLWVTHQPRPDDPALGGSVTYYNARAMARLTWFFTPVGIVAIWFGFAVLALRRWSFDRWVVVVPSVVLLPVYLQDARIAPRLIWWTRRFVPFALPGMFLLIAIGVGWLLSHARVPLRLAGAVVGTFLVAAFLVQSWPLRHHDELAGSFFVHDVVAGIAGTREAVWLWANGPTPAGINPSAPAFASTLLYRNGDPVTRFDASEATTVATAYRSAFPHDPVFVVADGRDLPGELSALAVDKVQEIAVNLPLWELTYDRRPTHAAPMPFVFTVFRLRGT
jgi:4-amino-4-deoxy-L-arabinose transferase-like glycosyltransferase